MVQELELRRRKILFLFTKRNLSLQIYFCCRRLFAKNGYSVALVARGAANVEKIADEINKSGGDVSSPSYSYSYSHIIPVRLSLFL